MSNKTKGIIAILIAAFGFASMSIFVKLAGDLPAIQKVIFRNVVSMVVSFIMVTYHKESYFGQKGSRKQLLLRSAIGTIGMVIFFYSLNNIVAADANMLNKLSSFFLILFSYLFLKEKISKKQLIAIIIAFTGALFIIKPSFDFDLLPYLAAFFSAMCAGGAYTVLRALRQKEKYYTIVFFFSTFSVVVLLPFVIYFYQPMSNLQWLYLFLAGLSATVGQFGVTIAYKHAPASEISIFLYMNVVFVTLLGIPFLGEYPDIFSIIGYVVIFLASYSMIHRHKTTKNTPK